MTVQTLQRPWPPGTYEAAYARARDEQRAAEWRRAYDHPFAHYDEHEAEPGPDWPPPLAQPDGPVTDDEWDRLALRYPTPAYRALEQWASAQLEPWTRRQAWVANRKSFPEGADQMRPYLEQLERAGVVEAQDERTFTTSTTPLRTATLLAPTGTGDRDAGHGATAGGSA